MLYIVIFALVGVLAYPLCADCQNHNWDVLSIFTLVCFGIVVVGGFLLYSINEDFDVFEEKITSSKKEMKRLIYPLDMSAPKPGKYFIIPRKNGAYRLYVQTETGFEQTEYDIDETELKQCNEKYPEPCVVETVTTTAYEYTPRYKKFLYYGVVFLSTTNKPDETEEKVEYTLYVPQNTIIQ